MTKHTLTTQMRFRVTNTREEQRKYDKGHAPLIEAKNGSENMELRAIANTDENGGGYLPHMSEWFAIEIRLLNAPPLKTEVTLRTKVTHPAGLVARLQELASRTDIEECVVYAWDAATGKYEVYDLDKPIYAHSSTPWEVIE